MIGKLKRIRIANLPTPIEKAFNLSETLGVNVWFKRDDYTGIGLWGNKARKLEFLIADVLDKGCDTIITSCGIQSNWARMVVAVANKFRLKTYLILRTAQFKDIPKEYDGNLLLDYILGADIKMVKLGIDEESTQAIDELYSELKSRGCKPYVIPAGGETALGALGYYKAFMEILYQAEEMDLNFNYIIHATGGGATQAGLVLGLKSTGLKTRVIGINVGAYSGERLRRNVVNFANEAAEIMDLNVKVNENEAMVINDYTFGGYGLASREVIEAIKLAAHTEGVILEPVYTGKAMVGLVDLAKRKMIKNDDNVLFIHTGGVPGIFPYRHLFNQY